LPLPWPGFPWRTGVLPIFVNPVLFPLCDPSEAHGSMEDSSVHPVPIQTTLDPCIFPLFSGPLPPHVCLFIIVTFSSPVDASPSRPPGQRGDRVPGLFSTEISPSSTPFPFLNSRTGLVVPFQVPATQYFPQAFLEPFFHPYPALPSLPPATFFLRRFPALPFCRSPSSPFLFSSTPESYLSALPKRRPLL